MSTNETNGKEENMNGYRRTTRECGFDQLDPGLRQALGEYFQAHGLGDAQSGSLLCCETVSERPSDRNAGTNLALLLYGARDTTIRLAMALTAEWLVWARSGDLSGTVATGAKLQVIKVKPFVARRTKYMDLEVSGFVNASKEYVRGNLQMGAEEAAKKFCEEVSQAVQKAAPPAKNRVSRWFGM